jgi:hypothetical protein
MLSCSGCWWGCAAAVSSEHHGCGKAKVAQHRPQNPDVSSGALLAPDQDRSALQTAADWQARGRLQQHLRLAGRQSMHTIEKQQCCG